MNMAAPVPETSGVSSGSSRSASSFSRVIGALFSPGPTFASIAQRPTWILPLILITILAFATTYFYTQRVGWRSFMTKQIEESPRTQSMTQDQKNEIIEKQTRAAPAISYTFVVVIVWGGTAIIAAILMGAFNLLGGASVKFKQSLAIASYASLPALVTQLLGMLMIFIKDPSTVDIQNLVASNAGAFLPDGSAKWLVALGGSLDIFSFWVMVLMAVGYAATNPRKLSFGKSFGIVFACWLLYVVVKVGLTGVFS